MTSGGSRSNWLLLRWLLLTSFVSSGLLYLFFSSPAAAPLAGKHSEARFLDVPQIAWGLNNQKIALARALLTARFLNRSLVLPSLSASLTYKDTSHVAPLPFDHLFSLPHFNKLCKGFVSITKPSADFSRRYTAFNVSKGSGRRWTKERDLEQLLECRRAQIHSHMLLRILGKNPFLWHDHWPAHDYARIFQCLVLVKNISADVDHIVSKLKQTSLQLSRVQGMHFLARNNSYHSEFVTGHKTESLNDLAYGHGSGYVAVHMRVEIDWMIHCRKTEERIRAQRGKPVNICSSKQEIMYRVSRIQDLQTPAVVYLAVADALLKDGNLLEGWDGTLLPVEKKKLGLLHVYQKYPYLIQSALDYEVCLRADAFIGNSFSTFSSLIALERTLKLLASRPSDPCSGHVYPSYAYNVQDKSGGPQLWVTNLSDVSLQAISYGTDQLSCERSRETGCFTKTCKKHF